MLKPLLCAAAALLVVNPALAAPPATPAPAAKPASTRPAAPRGPAKPRSAKSMACSKEADGKNLHGAPRSAFMRKCNKTA